MFCLPWQPAVVGQVHRNLADSIFNIQKYCAAQQNAACSERSHIELNCAHDTLGTRHNATEETLGTGHKAAETSETVSTPFFSTDHRETRVMFVKALV